MSLPNRRPLLTCYHWECGSATFETIAPDMDEGFDRACREAAARGLHDEALKCVDEEPYDPTGGDGDDD